MSTEQLIAREHELEQLRLRYVLLTRLQNIHRHNLEKARALVPLINECVLKYQAMAGLGVYEI